MKITIVNEQDKVIGSKERNEITQKDIYRVSGLWITNREGKILLARRALDKKNHPGRWGPAVAGTIDEGETYESNIVKEAEEELGLNRIIPIKSHKNRVKSPFNHFTQWFTLKLDKGEKDFNFDKREVIEVKWFTKDEMEDLINNHPEKVIGSLQKRRYEK